MSEFDISWRGLRNGDIDFPFVFQGFWGAEGVEILIFHGLEGGCVMEMLIFHWFFEAFWCARGMDGDIDFFFSGVDEGWKYRFFNGFSRFLGCLRDGSIMFSLVFQGF